MVDTKAAILFVMKQEDSTLSGIITNNKNDKGGTTRFGLTAQYHPELVDQGFFALGNVPTDRALVMAETAYETQYAEALLLEAFVSQAIATALLSFAVVEGNHPAVKCLQKSIVALGVSVATDGFIGNQTVNAANSCDPAFLLNKWIAFEEAYFLEIVDHNPTQQRFLGGWNNRAEALKNLL